MNFIKTYKYRLGITLGIIALFFVFQNGTCSNASNSTNSGGASTISNTSGTVSSALSLTAPSTSVALSGTLQLTTSGGSGAYFYSVTSGGGSVSNTGLYTAPNYASTATIYVSDNANGNNAFITINVGGATNTSAGISITPSSTTVPAKGTLQVVVSGGTAPYIFSVLSGGGSFPSTSTSYAVYQAPNATGTVTLLVTDSLKNTNTVSITVTAGTNFKFVGAIAKNRYSAQWTESNLTDGDPSTCYSSIRYAVANPSVPPSVQLTLADSVSGATGSVYAINHLYITDRNNGTTTLGFPLTYTIMYLLQDGSGWGTIGTFQTQPQFDGVARINFTSITTSQIAIVGNYLTTDGTGANYYLQLCEVSQ